MITLPNDMAIDADSRQFILKQKRIVEKGDNAGKSYWKEVGYYPTLSHLIGALFERRLYSVVSEVKTLRDAQTELEQWARDLKSPLLCELRTAVMDFGTGSDTTQKGEAQ